MLDPATGACGLYASRPIMCRVFGLPIRANGGIGVCELNFIGADQSEILAAWLDTSWNSLETALNGAAEAQSGSSGPTTIAWAIAGPAASEPTPGEK